MSFPVAARKHNHTHKKNIRRPRSLLLLSSVSLFSIFLILKFRKRHHGPNKTQKAQVVGNLGERNKTTGVWCVCSLCLFLSFFLSFFYVCTQTNALRWLKPVVKRNANKTMSVKQEKSASGSIKKMLFTTLLGYYCCCCCIG